MEMNIGHAMMSLGAIEAVMKENGQERKLPFKVKHRLTRIKDVLQKDANIYEEERVKLIREYGDEVEKDGEKVLEVKDPEKLAKFYEAVDVILKTPIDPEYVRLSQDDLKLIEDLDIDISETFIKAFFEYVVEA